MDNDLFIITTTGFMAGTVHVLTGPDHLAAVAPLSAHAQRKSGYIGLWWGLGHTGSTWFMGMFVLLFKELISFDVLSQWSERLVGLVLIAIGLWGIQKTYKTHLHTHQHEHDGISHVHVHVHGKTTQHPPHAVQAHRHKHAPLGIGALHGFAGSSHFLAILPAIALNGRLHSIMYLVAFGTGTILSMACFSWMIGFVLQRSTNKLSGNWRWGQIGLSLAAVGVGAYWLSNW